MSNKKRKRFPTSKLKVAIVTDPLIRKEEWQDQLKYIIETFPNSELFTPYYKAELVKEILPEIKIHDSFLQLILPDSNRKPIWLKLERIAYKMFSLRKFDAVISISSRCAKFVRTGKDIKHIAITVSPKRLFKKEGLHSKDVKAMEKLDAIIANSISDKRKIRRIYKINSDVIYPPINVKKFKPEKLLNRKENWFLVNSNISMRALRLVIKAAVQADTPLKIVGPLREGVDVDTLTKELKTRGLVKFLGEIPEEGRISLMQRCRAFIYPVKSRTFGKAVVEANASGTAVIAYRRGAVIETVSTEHPKSGLFFNKYNYKSLAKVLRDFDDKEFNSKCCIINAQEFDSSIFMYKLKTYVEDVLQNN